ncbi:hypothetical protein, partial [Enterobacter bugandensis]|uniref:hypothetical protein n=1 Tax=Enterobacter bugandensis TaxID=881260 RepID=UPI002A7F6D11
VTTILSVASLSASYWAMSPGLMLTAKDLSKVPDDSLCQNGGPSRDLLLTVASADARQHDGTYDQLFKLEQNIIEKMEHVIERRCKKYTNGRWERGYKPYNQYKLREEINKPSKKLPIGY